MDSLLGAVPDKMGAKYFVTSFFDQHFRPCNGFRVGFRR